MKKYIRLKEIQAEHFRNSEDEKIWYKVIENGEMHLEPWREFEKDTYIFPNLTLNKEYILVSKKCKDLENIVKDLRHKDHDDREYRSIMSQTYFLKQYRRILERRLNERQV